MGVGAATAAAMSIPTIIASLDFYFIALIKSPSGWVSAPLSVRAFANAFRRCRWLTGETNHVLQRSRISASESRLRRIDKRKSSSSSSLSWMAWRVDESQFQFHMIMKTFQIPLLWPLLPSHHLQSDLLNYQAATAAAAEAAQVCRVTTYFNYLPCVSVKLAS